MSTTFGGSVTPLPPSPQAATINITVLNDTVAKYFTYLVLIDYLFDLMANARNSTAGLRRLQLLTINGISSIADETGA